jgi:small subunit ribosomal protein S20
MAITSGAKKAIRTAKRRRLFNLYREDAMKDALKSFRKTVAAGKTSDAEKSLPALYQALDKAAKRGVIKKGTAARLKSRAVASLRKTQNKKK